MTHGPSWTKSRELAEALGARSWSCIRRSGGSASTRGTSRRPRGDDAAGDVAFAVENLYPLLRGETEIAAYAPHWNPVEMDCRRHPRRVARCGVGFRRAGHGQPLGDRLAHVHLGDGTKPGLPDEHLVPGRGTQPCAELLGGWRVRSATRASSCSRSARTARRRSPTGRLTWPSRWTSPGGTWPARTPPVQVRRRGSARSRSGQGEGDRRLVGLERPVAARGLVGD